MADRVQRMLENQRKREEAMKAKEAAAQAEATAAAEAAKPKEAYVSKFAAAPKARERTPLSVCAADLFAPLPPVERGKPTHIGGDASGENIIYANGNNFIIRNVKNPLIADTYSDHSHAGTVARFSPDNKYIASADVIGNVRIWHREDVDGMKHKIKFEKKALGGSVQDMAWCMESKRLIAVGNGRDTLGCAFMVDGGASVGTITGHSKTITTCAISPKKPMRVITGSEDLQLNWFEGPPFKFKFSHKTHTRFPNQIRFSPDGNLFLSVGQDKKGLFGDGTTGELKHELSATDGHKGGIYGCAWSPDSTQVLTSSGDKTCKLWDVATGNVVTTFKFGNQLENQQLGCYWAGDSLLSINLAGHITYLDRNSPDKPIQVIHGHNKAVEAVAYHAGKKALYTASYDAVTVRWNESSGVPDRFEGQGHANQVMGMHVQGDNLVSVAMDDTARVTSLNEPLEFAPDSVKLGEKPLYIAVGSADSGLAVAVTLTGIHVIKNGKKVSSSKPSYAPKSVAVSPDNSEVAVGGDDNKIHLFSVSGDNLSESKTLDGHRGTPNALNYSPDGKLLASVDQHRDIRVWDRSSGEAIVQGKWVFHSARVNALAFSPDSKHLASCSLDCGVIVWTVATPTKRLHIKGAHHAGVTDVCWIDTETLASVGQDCCTRTWKPFKF